MTAHLGELAAALVDGELGHEARDRALAHLAGCVWAVSRGSRWASASRSCTRPRWMRLRTVPSLIPSVAAISS